MYTQVHTYTITHDFLFFVSFLPIHTHTHIHRHITCFHTISSNLCPFSLHMRSTHIYIHTRMVCFRTLSLNIHSLLYLRFSTEHKHIHTRTRYFFSQDFLFLHTVSSTCLFSLNTYLHTHTHTHTWYFFSHDFLFLHTVSSTCLFSLNTYTHTHTHTHMVLFFTGFSLFSHLAFSHWTHTHTYDTFSHMISSFFTQSALLAFSDWTHIHAHTQTWYFFSHDFLYFVSLLAEILRAFGILLLVLRIVKKTQSVQVYTYIRIYIRVCVYMRVCIIRIYARAVVLAASPATCRQ